MTKPTIDPMTLALLDRHFPVHANDIRDGDLSVLPAAKKSVAHTLKEVEADIQRGGTCTTLEVLRDLRALADALAEVA